MSTKFLKMTLAKTELLITKHNIAELDAVVRPEIMGPRPNPIKSVRNLAIHMDTELSLEQQVAPVAKPCFWQ